MFFKESLAQRARNIITSDRSQAIRSIADDRNTHCLFASIIQAALELGSDIPLRTTDFEKILTEFGDTDNDGGVKVEDVCSILERINEKFGMRVKCVYAHEKFNTDQFFNGAIQADETEREDNADTDSTCFLHAEFYNNTALTQERLDVLRSEGWVHFLAFVLDKRKRKPQKKEDYQRLIKKVSTKARFNGPAIVLSYNVVPNTEKSTE